MKNRLGVFNLKFFWIKNRSTDFFPICIYEQVLDKCARDKNCQKLYPLGNFKKIFNRKKVLANENGVINLVDAVADGSQDNTFFLVSGLATSSGYSFRSTRQNDEYINHSNARLRMDAQGRDVDDNTDLFQNDATWTLHIGDFKFI